MTIQLYFVYLRNYKYKYKCKNGPLDANRLLMPAIVSLAVHCRCIADLNSSGGRRAMQDEYHIAFGTKMAGSGQPRKSSAGKEVSGTAYCSVRRGGGGGVSTSAS